MGQTMRNYSVHGQKQKEHLYTLNLVQHQDWTQNDDSGSKTSFRL
jgi:hypothetical protein